MEPQPDKGRGTKGLKIEEALPPTLSSLPEQIATAVNDQIVKGIIAPGENIPEQRLSEYFRVSRGPVREALRILEREGVVIVTPRRGAQVTKLTVSELVETYEIRAVLFALAAKRMAQSPDPRYIAELQHKLRQMQIISESGGSAEEQGALSTAMTQVLCAGCGNRRLASMIQTLGRQIARYTVLSLSTEPRRAQSIRNWQSLVNAIAAGDSDGAHQVARSMVEQAIEHALPRLADE